MEWYWSLLIMLALLFGFFASGMPVSFAFLSATFVVIYFFMGGTSGFLMVVHSAFEMLTSFLLVPVSLFVLMGMILMQSGSGWLVIDALDKWVGRIPGRLSILAVLGGTIFAALSGLSMGTTAMLGSIFMPEMRKRGYSKNMSMGPIMAGGGLALIIPPSALAVIMGGLFKVSIGALLIACVLPGLVMSGLYIVYILYVALRHPDLAPKYEVSRVSFKERMISLQYILPLSIVVFLVTGVIFLGIATPTEASATGALASFLVVTGFKKLSRDALNKTIRSSVHITSMILLIIIGSVAFSRVLAYTGCTHGLANLTSNAQIHPYLVVIAMQLIVSILGTFMDLISIIMILVPIFEPTITRLGVDPIWFCTMMLTNLGVATLTPPFGNLLFVIKGVSPPDVTMREIIKAALPYVALGIVTIILLFIFPQLALWLPGLVSI
jgi:tripartite ATP-independent transporter DctM subunit